MSVFGIIMYLNYWTISCQIKVVQLAKKHRCKFKTCALIVNMQLAVFRPIIIFCQSYVFIFF